MTMYQEREFEFTRADFNAVRALIYQYAGIALADHKEQLVYSRLMRRLRALKLTSFKDYIATLSPEEPEWQSFLNALTTNLTAFFREQHHFPVLAEHLLAQTRRPIRLWSAASSTGEEPYSMAITAAEAFGRYDAPVEILASDLDTQVLEKARAGIYPFDRIEKIPLQIQKNFFRRGQGKQQGYCRVVPELQALLTFQRINLLDERWDIDVKFDAIFCRNVMIYFDKPTQRKLLEKFLRVLQPGGLFFAGHSESFAHASDLIVSIGRTIYKRAGPNH